LSHIELIMAIIVICVLCSMMLLTAQKYAVERMYINIFWITGFNQ